MRAEQPIKSCKLRQKMRMEVGAPFNPPLPPVIIADRPKAVLSLRFHLCYVRCCSVFKCFNFNTSVCLTELPPVWERAANSAYHLLFRCLLRYVCSCFPMMFRTSVRF